ncbi:hypothetical protein [Bacillus sp. PS06]|uniref:hypothetical protein n=1 Tax=Bacillus sp. PS06 TaxID=2764176 RepID=UPI0017830B2F|nr:hypothetical protein [Bacillus sp. PS06]MBD8068855.1 hypothetical protein [Bacillus sp. PS06]
MGYLFTFIAFLILVPLINKVPLGLKPRTKMLVLLLAFLLTLLGVFMSQFISIYAVAALLILLSILLVILLGNRVSEGFDEASLPTHTQIVRPKNRKIIVLDQAGDENHQDAYLVEQYEEFIEEDSTPPVNTYGKTTSEEVAVTEEEIDRNDWINSIDIQEDNERQHSEPVETIDPIKPNAGFEQLQEIVFEDQDNKK